jgi:hypothetical protein
MTRYGKDSDDAAEKPASVLHQDTKIGADIRDRCFREPSLLAVTGGFGLSKRGACLGKPWPAVRQAPSVAALMSGFLTQPQSREFQQSHSRQQN